MDIEQARAAADQNQWTPEVASKFWAASDSLCSLISPVSVDTLTTSKNRKNVETRFRSSYPSTLPQRIASTISISFGAPNFKRRAQLSDVHGHSDERRHPVVDQDWGSAGPRNRAWPFANAQQKRWRRRRFTRSADKEVQPTAAKATTALGKLYAVADQLYGKTTSLTPVTWKQYAVCGESGADENYCYQKGRAGISKQISNAQSNLDDYHLLARRASDIAEQAQTCANWIGSTILPVLLGMTGACAYIVRMLAEQIRTSSFSSTSNIRHGVRFISWRPCWSSNWFWRHRC